ncbi:flagellar biosynthesis filament capping protein [Marinobacter lipolyticus SM19]|uniref:Flagellar hook-associated protein 2 n=1 Tax=Marinobacter lipolyticus SM19 TaxID=1318628 RepID=R8B5J1_9GAMM|nr:flagellar filament capping protein FliD [Marinobacter lipolyticus]EON93880.1 flagellar biosynthesis filament capping protein [Marinobacter lipolyticus SM19]
MASITSLGAGSGIFSNDLVNQLVNAERAPTEQRLNQKQSLTEAKISAYGNIRSALEALRTPMEKLSTIEGMRAFTGTSSNEAVAGVSIDPSIANRGSYSLDVKQLAQAQSLASGVFADRDTTTVGTGTLTLNVGGVATDITVDGTNNTLEGMAASINEANVGVSASVVDTGSGFRLVMSAEDTGVDNAIQVSVADNDGNNTDGAGLSQFVFDGTASNMEETVQAKDAILDVNGIEITRSSNTVEGVIEGVTFDVKSIGTSTVKVEQDPEAVAGRVQEFVDKFNALQDVIQKFSGFNEASGQGGVLSGDSTVRGIQSELRRMLTTIPQGLEDSPIRMLADVGIKTDPSTGKLEFDQDVFKEQLEAYPEAMTALFAEKDGVEGIAERMVNVASDFIASDGALANRTDGLNRTLESIQDQRDRLDLRIASYEERLIRQFSAADSLIAQIQSNGNFVAQQLAALAPQNNQNQG